MQVAICVIQCQDHILLCQRKNKIWEFPGGKIEQNETPFQAIKRELKEELNLELTNFEWIGTLQNTIDEKNYHLHVFTTTIFYQQLQSNVHIQHQWIHTSTLDQFHTFPNTDKIVAMYLHACHTTNKKSNLKNSNYFFISEIKFCFRSI